MAEIQRELGAKVSWASAVVDEHCDRLMFMDAVVLSLFEYFEMISAAYVYRVGVYMISQNALCYGFRCIRDSADRGYSKAQWHCGEMLQNGVGCNVNRAAAVHYFKLSADQNDHDGEYRYAWCLMLGKDVQRDADRARRCFADLALRHKHPRGQMAYAMCLLEENQSCSEAIEMLISAQKSGCAEAAYIYAVCLKNGIGVPKDPPQALTYFRIAADHGIASANNYCGLILGEKLQRERLRHFFESADRGNRFGQYLYAKSLTDKSDTEFWCRMCADQTLEDDNPYGLYTNLFIEDMKETEAEYYRDSASDGCSYGAYMYGFCLRNGYGVAKDDQQADYMHALSAQSGNVYAAPLEQGRLDVSYVMGHFLEEQADLESAFRWFEEAALGGHTGGQYKYAMYWKEGVGTRRDLRKAAYYFGRSAKHGNMMAAYEYGLCLVDGIGVQRNLSSAAQFFKQAADQGHLIAQFRFGLCLEIGDGVEKDEQNAHRYFRMAADQGHLYAQLRICHQ